MDESLNEVVLCHPSGRRRVCDGRRLVLGLLTLTAVVLVAELFWTMTERHPVAGLIALVAIGLAVVACLIDVAEPGVRWFFVVRRARKSSLAWAPDGDAVTFIDPRRRRELGRDIPVGSFCVWERISDGRPNFGGSLTFVRGDVERRLPTAWFDDNRLVRRFLDDLIAAGVVVGPPIVVDRVAAQSVRPLRFASRREAILVGVLLVPLVIWRWLLPALGISV
jgi:hypothetical protein